MSILRHMDHSASLLRQYDRISDTAAGAAVALQDLARAANGNSGHIIPAPTMYAILGNLRACLNHTIEVVDFAPAGLANSLKAGLTITDRGPDGAPRDPAASVDEASAALRAARTSLLEALEALSAAQSAIGGQGWDE